jgi:hypothetical protein
MREPTRADDHRRYRELLGAYVLGQLEGAETVELERHLGECASCQAEVAELRALASVLPAADPSRPTQQSAGWDPSPELEDRVVDAVLAERGARSSRRPFGVWERFAVGLAAAAAIVAAVIGLTAVLTAPQGPPGLGEVEPIAFSEAPKNVSTEAAVVAHTWGTEIRLKVEGLKAGEIYTVRLERDTGELVSAGTFVAIEDKPVECRLNGAVLRQDARAISVANAASGEVVMRANLKPRPDLASSATMAGQANEPPNTTPDEDSSATGGVG